MKVCFETFGCRLNKAEALQMEAEYLAKGWELTDKHADADVIVVRGCSVTARAQRDCQRLIDHLRRHYPATPIRVCGCLPKSTVTGRLKTSDKISDLAKTNTDALPTRTARAYLKVQDGCAGKCTFCIVPKFRGPSKSESFIGLLGRAKRFVDSGYHEIVVTGCNLSLYASEGKRLPELLSALAGVSPDCRIRLGSLEPGDCALETVQAMSEHANICRFLHVPVQSASNRILLAMRRPYAVRDVEKLADLATRLMPNLGLGCDLMTGFPGETDADVSLTRALLERYSFVNAHVFPYSERPGTPAAALQPSVPKDVRSERARLLAKVIKDLRAKYLKRFVGQEVELVVESEKSSTGWTSEYVFCEAAGSAARKSLVKVRVLDIKDGHLTGRLLAR